MATHRRPARKETPPVNTYSNGTDTAATTVDSGPLARSAFLPTVLEAVLLALYPSTLLLGSLFSSLHPSTRHAEYSGVLQSYVPEEAPSYFAKKSNLLNVYFVKIGWFWVTLAFILLLISHPSLGPPFRAQFTRRRAQAALRYVCVSTGWIFVTQWFFGPPIIDRSFRWTGGQCEVVLGNKLSDRIERAEMSDAREAFTHAACKAIGGQWKGGHDISGHVFLLILGSAMLWLELLPAVLRMEGFKEARRIRTTGGLIRSASTEGDGRGDTTAATQRSLGVGVKVALLVAGLSWWMLLMTAAYFHTWFEKFTGLLVAFSVLYSVYFLPRGVPGLREILGMP